MTLLQRISRNVKNIILIFPRSGSRRRGLNIIFVAMFFITFTVYLSGRQAGRVNKLPENLILKKKDFSLVTKSENGIYPTKFVQQLIIAQSIIKTIPMNLTRLMSSAEKNRSSSASSTSISTSKTAHGSSEKLLQMASNNVKNCKKNSTKLIGDMKSNPNITPSMDEVIEHVGPNVLHGGCFVPTTCKALQKVAILIPFKDRDAHLKTLLYHLHPMLMRQPIQYCIYVAEQFDNGQFNKALVMNAAFVEALKLDDYDCVIFHDVDMIPENDKNLYMCGKNPRHLSPAIDKFNYKPHYGTEFGGVTGITPDQYRKANGHSNRFWGWGGEDNDMEFRIQYRNMSITPSAMEVGRYMMIPHLHPWKFKPNKFPLRLNKTRMTRAQVDGLSDLQYQLAEIIRYPLYTKLVIDIRIINVTKLTLYINGKSTMDVDLYPGECWYDEFPGKYLDHIIELTDKKEAQELPLWPGNKHDGKSNRLKDNLVAPNGRKRRFAMLHNLKQAQELCENLRPECSGIQRENSQENYSLRKGVIPRHLVILASSQSLPRGVHNHGAHQGDSKPNSDTEKRYLLPDKKAYLRYCPGESSYFKPYKEPFVCHENVACSHTYGVEVHFTVMLKPLQYLFYEDEKHFESRLEKGSNHHTFTWPNNIAPDPTISKTKRSFTFRTPDFMIPNLPGTYAVESKIADRLQNPYFQWNWWFEVTSGNKVDDARIREEYWKKKMKENVIKNRAKQHQAMMLEKQERARKNQIEFDKKMAELRNKNQKRSSQNKEKGIPPQIEKIVGKMQEHYNKGNLEAVEEDLDPNAPELQKRVGQIKESVDSNDPQEEPKVSSSTTRKTTLQTIKLATNRQFHLIPKSKLQQRR